MTPPVRTPSAATMALRTAVILFLFVVVFTGLLAGAYLATRPTIEAAAAAEKMALIDEVLPRGSTSSISFIFSAAAAAAIVGRVAR